MRPSVILKDYPLHFVDGVEMATHFSFPSGHTTFAFAFFGFLALNSTKTIFKLLYLFLAVLVALSRIYLLQHFLIDTIVGSMIGFLCALIGHFVYEKINSKNTAS
jgi:membrane-associated phospholipid phosphatase